MSVAAKYINRELVAVFVVTLVGFFANNLLGRTFFGTSASAPHAAGAIALMKSRFGVFTLEDIRDILLGRALDRGIAGMDNIYGHGRLDVKGQ